jgi:WD40 repeat protein
LIRQRTKAEPNDPIPIGDLEAVTALTYYPFGHQLAAGGLHGGVRLWAVSSGTTTPIDRWRPSTRSITSLAFTPDGERLAVGTEDGRLILLDTMLGLELVNSALGNGAVTGLAFDPAGRKLAVIHGERVLLWE